MADGNIDIDVRLNPSEAESQSGNIGKKIGSQISKGVEDGMKGAKNAAKDAAENVEEPLKKAAESAKSSLSSVGSSARSSLSDVGDAARDASSDAASAFESIPADAQGAFSDVSNEAQTGFSGIVDAAETASDGAADALDGIGDAARSSGDEAANVFDTKIVAAGNLAASAIEELARKVADFVQNAISTGMEFDKSMAQVAATMGVAVDEVGDLRDFAQEMGETTAFSASQAADALNYMALAGYDAETSMRVLPTVLNLAAAGNMELAAASDMVTDAQSALGLSVEQAEVMVDQMAKTSSKTNTSVEQLGNAFLTVGGTAKNLKGGTAELAQMLGILADNGIKGSEGGTALRNVILSLSAPTDTAAEEIKKLGLAVFDAEGNMRSMPDIVADLNSSMESLTQQEKTEALNTIFNKVDLKSVNALLGTSSDRFNEVASAIDNAQGSAQSMADTQLDNLAGDVTLMQSATEGFFIAVSNKLTPALRDLTQFATNLGIPALTDMVKNADKLAPAILSVVTAIAGFTVSRKIMRALASEEGIVAKATAAMGIEFKTASTSAKLSAVAVQGFRAALQALKSVAIVLAISAAIEAFFAIADAIEKARKKAEDWNDSTKGLENAAVGVSNAISGEAESFQELNDAIDAVDIQSIMDAHKQLADSMKEVDSATSATVNSLDDYGSAIEELNGKNLDDEQAANLKIAVDGLNETLGTSYEVTQDADGAYRIMADGAEVATSKIIELINAQKNQIQVEAALEKQKSVYKQLTDDQDKYAEASAAVANAQDALKDKMASLGMSYDDLNTYSEEQLAMVGKELQAYNDAINTQKEVEGQLGSTQSAYNRLTEQINLMTQAQAEGASAFVKAAAANREFQVGVQSVGVNLTEFTKALEGMGYTAEDIANINTEQAQKMALGWKDGTQGLIDAATEAGVAVPDKLREMGEEARDAGNETAKNYAEGLSEEGQLALDSALEVAGISLEQFNQMAADAGVEGEEATLEFARGISSKGSDAKTSAEDVSNSSAKGFGAGDPKPQGQHQSTEFIGGMESKRPEIITKAESLSSDAATKMGSKNSQASTSGQNLVQGLWNGIHDKASWALNQIGGFAQQIIDKVKNVFGIQSPSKVMKEEVGKNIALGVAKGIESNAKYAKKSAAELGDAVVSAANKRLSQYKRGHDMSLKAEEAYWVEIRKHLKKGTAAYKEASTKILEIRKKQAEETKKARKKAAQDAKKAQETEKKNNEKLLKAEQDFVSKIKDIQQNLTESIQKARDAYNQAVEDRKNAILADFNLFSRYAQKSTISGKKLIENMQTQLKATQDYSQGLQNLEKRIGRGQLYQEIADMGMDGLRYIKSLNEMSDEELQEFIRLYEERNKIAGEQAVRDNKELLDQTNQTIKDLNAQAAKDIKAAANELKKTASELGTSAAKAVAKMAANIKVSTNDITKSINNAINSIDKLNKKTTKKTTTTYTEYKPSSSWSGASGGSGGVGRSNDGISVMSEREAVFDDAGQIQGYSLLRSDLGSFAQTEESLLKGMAALTMAVNNSGTIGRGDTTNTQNITFNTPVQSPDDVARAMRMQQFYGLAGEY